MTSSTPRSLVGADWTRWQGNEWVLGRRSKKVIGPAQQQQPCGCWDHLLTCTPSADLPCEQPAGNQDGNTVWRSDELVATKLPLRFKFVANGHRSSPNT